MLILKQENERLHRVATSKSLTSSQSSLQTHDGMDRRYSTTDVPTDRTGNTRHSLASRSHNRFIVVFGYTLTFVSAELDLMFTENADMDAKKVAVWVLFGSHGSYHKYVDERNERNECPISLIPVSTKTNWEVLDGFVFRAFKVRVRMESLISRYTRVQM